MTRTLLVSLFASSAALSSPSAAATELAPDAVKPVHTYSIIARDPASGQLGVAVQSHNFAVGTVVPWAEPGVGAVAIQSIPDPSYGKRGLDMMRAGDSAPDVLRALLSADAGRELRQVAMIDARGRVAAHTGNRNIPAAGHVVGENFSVQANLVLSDKVWPAMAHAFETTRGSLAERMLAALDAAQEAGGDIRGKQSAALIVVAGTVSGNYWADRPIDLRVDDAIGPLKELRRLLVLRRAYDHLEVARQAQRRNEYELALKEYRAASGLVPENAEFIYWHAVALVRMNRVEDALPLFRRAYELDSAWTQLAPRLAKVGFLPEDDALIRRVVDAGKK